MMHIAIDLGSGKSQVCVRQPNGDIAEEGLHSTSRLSSRLKRYPPSRVILETCAEAFFVADAAIAAGHDVRIVPATLVRTLVGLPGKSNQTTRWCNGRANLPTVAANSSPSWRWPES